MRRGTGNDISQILRRRGAMVLGCAGLLALAACQTSGGSGGGTGTGGTPGTPASAYGFEGLWAYAATQYCGPVGDAVPIRITSTDITFYESACDLTTVQAVAGNSWTAAAQCQGEGMVWQETYSLTRSNAGGQERLTMVSGVSNNTWDLVMCP